MNNNSQLDWRFVIAVGVTASGVISLTKMDKDAIERVVVHAIDALKDLAIAMTSNR